MEEEIRAQAGQVLLAMTMVEAAAMDLLATIQREREAMRRALEGDANRG